MFVYNIQITLSTTQQDGLTFQNFHGSGSHLDALATQIRNVPDFDTALDLAVRRAESVEISQGKKLQIFAIIPEFNGQQFSFVFKEQD